MGQQALRFLVGRCFYGLNAREKRSIVENRIRMRGEFRRDSRCDFIHFRGGIGALQVEEYGGDAVEGQACAFQGLNGVLPGRSVLIGSDRCDFSIVFS